MNLYWMITVCTVSAVALLALTIYVYGRELIELVKVIHGPRPSPVVSEERLSNAKAYNELWDECLDLRRSISVLANNMTKARVKK